jgi:hypothetical protein
LIKGVTIGSRMCRLVASADVSADVSKIIELGYSGEWLAW